MSAITEKDWECPICLSVMDGVNQGQVALSKRCYHVFHKVCIEQSLNEANRKCPNCKLEYFSICEVLPNPEFEAQYQKWDLDRIGYTYERAVREEYGRSSQEVGFDPSHILRPVALRGLDQRRMLTREEIKTYYLEVRAEIQALGVNATPEQIAKAKKEAEEGESLMLDLLEEWNQRQFDQLDNQTKRLDHLDLTGSYDRKIRNIRRKLRFKKSQIDQLACTKENLALGGVLLDLSTRLTGFSREFTRAGKTNERTIEESQELLKEVDARLDAFIEEQPAHIKEILNAPLPQEPRVPVQPNEDPIRPAAPNNPPEQSSWWESTTAKLLGVLALVVGFVTFKHYVWNKRSVQHKDEL